MPYKDPEKARESCRRYKQRPENQEAFRRYSRKYANNPKNRVKIRLKHCLKTKRYNDTTLGRVNSFQRWTEQEIAFLWDTSYTTKEIADLLERSLCAVAGARVRFASKRPADYRHNGNRRIEE